MDFRKYVLWSNESKFNLFRADGKVMIWRSPKEGHDLKCTVSTVKYGSGGVEIWGYCT